MSATGVARIGAAVSAPNTSTGSMTMPLMLRAEPSNGIMAKNVSTNVPIARSPVELLANSRSVIAEACAATSASARCCAVISNASLRSAPMSIRRQLRCQLAHGQLMPTTRPTHEQMRGRPSPTRRPPIRATHQPHRSRHEYHTNECDVEQDCERQPDPEQLDERHLRSGHRDEHD